MSSIDEAKVLADLVERGIHHFEPAYDHEQVAEVTCQVWQMHKHGMVGEPWVEDEGIRADLTDEGKRRYAELGIFELDDREEPIIPCAPAPPDVPRDVIFAAEMLRHAASKVFPSVSPEVSQEDGAFWFSAGKINYQAKVSRGGD